MKTAEDIEESIRILVSTQCRVDFPKGISAYIIQALTAYATERVREAYHCCQEPRVAHERARAEGYAEAREEAAKVAENSFVDWELHLVDHARDRNLIAERTFIAHAIRALKNKP